MAEAQPANGNPAVVGLAGFGPTAMILQLHNAGSCGVGPIVALGLVFGGLAQMIAGFQEPSPVPRPLFLPARELPPAA